MNMEEKDFEIKVKTEQAILGCAIAFPGECLEPVLKRCNDKSFAIEENKIVFGLLKKLHSRKIPIDLLNLQKELNGEISATYLVELEESVISPLASNFDYHLGQIAPPFQSGANGEVEYAKALIEEVFPGTWEATEACLSVLCQHYISDICQPFNLNLIGDPSKSKTLVLSYFYGLGDIVYKSDNFTAHSFVSHSPKKKSKELEKVDLLPRIKDKTLITPEMNSLFSVEGDKLNEILGIITRIIDGEGYKSDSGTHGERGYAEPIFFTWLGATTPIRRGVWNIMSRYGSKMYFYNINSKEADDEFFYETILAGRPFQEKLADVRGVIEPLMAKIRRTHEKARVVWDKTKEPKELMLKIVKYARLLASLRMAFTIWEKDENYDTANIVKEGIYRGVQLLYNIGRGRALLYGRNYIDETDLPLVLRVAMSSAEQDRAKLLRLLIESEDGLDTNLICEKLSVSEPTARKKLESLKIMGLADISYSGSNHLTTCQLKEDFEWLRGAFSLKGN